MRHKILILGFIFIVLVLIIVMFVLYCGKKINTEVESNKNNELIISNNILNKRDSENNSLEQLPYNYSYKDAIKDGYFTIIPDGVYNKENLDDFIEKTKFDSVNRKKASVRIAITTIEGQLILYDLSYDGKDYILQKDFTRDGYSLKEDRIIKIKNDIPGYCYTINLNKKENIMSLEFNLYPGIPSDSDEKKYEDIFIVSYKENATVYQKAPEFNAKVKEVYDNALLVEPVENNTSLGDKVSVSCKGDFKVGDSVKVIYTGIIVETYPVQINEISVEKIEILND